MGSNEDECVEELVCQWCYLCVVCKEAEGEGVVLGNLEDVKMKKKRLEG